MSELTLHFHLEVEYHPIILGIWLFLYLLHFSVVCEWYEVEKSGAFLFGETPTLLTLERFIWFTSVHVAVCFLMASVLSKSLHANVLIVSFCFAYNLYMYMRLTCVYLIYFLSWLCHMHNVLLALCKTSLFNAILAQCIQLGYCNLTGPPVCCSVGAAATDRGPSRRFAPFDPSGLRSGKTGDCASWWWVTCFDNCFHDYH